MYEPSRIHKPNSILLVGEGWVVSEEGVARPRSTGEWRLDCSTVGTWLEPFSAAAASPSGLSVPWGNTNTKKDDCSPVLPFSSHEPLCVIPRQVSSLLLATEFPKGERWGGVGRSSWSSPTLELPGKDTRAWRRQCIQPPAAPLAL